MSGIVLEFDGVTLPEGREYDTGLASATFSLREGDLAWVRLRSGAVHIPLADAAQGLLAPVEGSVRYLGQNWEEARPDEANRLRSLTGRVFDGYGWISNLDVDENIILSQRYHTARSVSELLAEAEGLARDFGLLELVSSRPASTARYDLILSGWVRAFMGSPRLILLERPERDVALEPLQLLARMVRERLDAGAAVVWISDDHHETLHSDLMPTLQFDMKGPKLVPVA